MTITGETVINDNFIHTHTHGHQGRRSGLWQPPLSSDGAILFLSAFEQLLKRFAPRESHIRWLTHTQTHTQPHITSHMSTAIDLHLLIIYDMRMQCMSNQRHTTHSVGTRTSHIRVFAYICLTSNIRLDHCTHAMMSTTKRLHQCIKSVWYHNSPQSELALIPAVDALLHAYTRKNC